MSSVLSRGTMASQAEGKSSRMLPLDSLRGFIIVLMALDHANSFIAHGKLEMEQWADQFPTYGGDALIFLTRFVTHLAAPGFFFLMGASMVLFSTSRRERGWSNWRITYHFVIRGVLLILLQLLVENPAWQIGQPPSPTALFGVLYGLGVAMIVGALLVRLPAKWLAGLGALLIVATELLLPDAGSGMIEYAPALRLWLLPGYAPVPGLTPDIFVAYSAMTWLGVAALGMAYGRWLKADREQAYRGAFWLGVAALLLFIPIRLLDGFGNIRPVQEDGWIGFLNVVKYPPSITFLLLTLGGDLLLLSLFAQAAERTTVGLQQLAVFGRVPLFFYLIHLYLYGYIGQWIDPDGIGIPRMFPYWLLGLVILFPVCWLYGRFKHNRSPHSLWRFL
jgi:uncharacterized membrane protein